MAYRSPGLCILMLMLNSMAFAAHPLITDDPGTQGTAKFQVEVNGETAIDEETDATGSKTETRESELAVTFAAGIAENVDVIIGIPYAAYEVTIDGTSIAKESGLSDVAMELKWRFFDKEGFSLALKPGVSFATGDDEKGLGTGKTGYSMFAILSKESGPLTVLANAGYIRNENNADEEKNVMHASIAGLYKAADQLTIVVNMGGETNPDKAADKDPVFGLAGVIYGVTESIDADFGVKFGLNDVETDIAYMAGIALRF